MGIEHLLGLWGSPSIPDADAVALQTQSCLGVSESLGGGSTQQAGHVTRVDGATRHIVCRGVPEIDNNVRDGFSDIHQTVCESFGNGLMGHDGAPPLAWAGAAGAEIKENQEVFPSLHGRHMAFLLPLAAMARQVSDLSHVTLRTPQRFPSFPVLLHGCRDWIFFECGDLSSATRHVSESAPAFFLPDL